MGQIRMSRLNTNFISTFPSTTVGQIAQALAWVPEKARGLWYIVVRLPDREFAIIGLDNLLEIAEKRGPSVHALALQEAADLLTPSLWVERTAQGIGQARKVMRRSPNRRLVVTEDGEPVGLLVDEKRAGGFGGLMTTLFGRERKRTSVTQGNITYRCPQCPLGDNCYDFADIIDLATNRLVCPRGHQAKDEV